MSDQTVCESVKLYRAVHAALASALLCACATPPVAEFAPAPAERAVYVVAQGGHTGLAVRRADVPPALIPEKRDFPDSDWLEFGWGDRDFYMTPRPGPWISFKAAFLPTQSAVHVQGVQGALAAVFPASEIVDIPVSRPALQGLLRYIHESFARADGPAASLGRGFYPGRDSFHGLRTCNVWTARALRAAGLPVEASLTVEGIMAQVRPLSRR